METTMASILPRERFISLHFRVLVALPPYPPTLYYF